MTLGNMRANGVRSLDVSCWQCHHRAVLSADPWPDHGQCQHSVRAWYVPAAASSARMPGRTGRSNRHG
jgi:hypothetical protein